MPRPRSRSEAPGTRPIGSDPGGAAPAVGGAGPEMSVVTRRDEWAEARAVSIVHDMPGRLRLRLPPGASTAGLTDVIDRLNGARSSVWSPRTRSLLIRYDASVLTPEEITRTVAAHADLEVPSPSDGPHAADDHP